MVIGWTVRRKSIDLCDKITSVSILGVLSELSPLAALTDIGFGFNAGMFAEHARSLTPDHISHVVMIDHYCFVYLHCLTASLS